MTLDDSALWLVEQPVPGDRQHLKLGPGAILQFGANQADDVYAEVQRVFLVPGIFETAGTAERPVTLKPSDLFSQNAVVIQRCPTSENCSNSSEGLYSYTNVINPLMDGDQADRVVVSRNHPGEPIPYMIRDGERRSEDNPYFRVPYVSNSRFKRLAHESPWARYQDDGLYIFAYGYNTDEGWPRPKSYQTVLFDNTILEELPTKALTSWKTVLF